MPGVAAAPAGVNAVARKSRRVVVIRLSYSSFPGKSRHLPRRRERVEIRTEGESSGASCRVSSSLYFQETRTEVKGNGERQSAVDGVGGSGAFPADRGGGGSFGACRTVIPAAGNVLGSDYDFGDYAVLARRGAGGFLAAVCGNGAWSGCRGDCSELLGAARAGVRC